MFNKKQHVKTEHRINAIISKLIIFLIRKKLKLGKYDIFKFTNQKQEGTYMFLGNRLVKADPLQGLVYSEVSLNWLLNDYCKVKVIA